MFREGHPTGEFTKKELLKTIEKPEVTAADIRTDAPEIDGTKFILQRHERYQLSGDHVGSLTEASAQKAHDQSTRILKEMLEPLSEEERRNVAFLVVGSNTKHHGKGMRSMETAGKVLEATKNELTRLDLGADQIINNRSGSKGVAPIAKMQAPRLFDDSPTYTEFLIEKYGAVTQQFWKAFEEDTHKEERIAFGAEGPDEMDQRFSKYLSTLSKYAETFHRENPGKRLVIWAVSHYDTVSPYIKRHITKTDPHQYLAVDYGAGVSVDIGADGKATSVFQGEEYDVDLAA
ncbi:MAG: hypothetical protein NUV56_02795 [Candidatus Uhrbacteria bacterium]|nr:hypothetical protein [Candidatus Uhrbacteria bacterium]